MSGGFLSDSLGNPPLDGPRHHHRLTDSTNERARELAIAGAPDGTVVTADSQSAGRGRHGRRWSAPPGAALLCSMILRPIEPVHALLPLAVPLAVCAAAESLADVECKVKWPNDVWLRERKLAGVLIEARPPEWAVVGVGLNLSIGDDGFPPDVRWPATSLGGGVSADQALKALLDAVGSWASSPADRVVAEFERRDALHGREVAWEGGGGASGSGSGTAAGIDERGNLVVDVGGGALVALGAGEVSLRL